MPISIAMHCNSAGASSAIRAYAWESVAAGHAGIARHRKLPPAVATRKDAWRMVLLVTALGTLVPMCVATIVAASHATSPSTIALADLSAQGVSATEAAVVSDQLRTALQGSGRFTVVERTEMQSVLREQGFQQAGCVSDICAVEIGQLLGVRRMVVGTLGQAGRYVLLNLRFVDVQSGQIVYSLSEKYKGGINEIVEKGVDRVTARIVKEYQPQETAAVLPDRMPADTQAVAPSATQTQPSMPVEPVQAVQPVETAVPAPLPAVNTTEAQAPTSDSQRSAAEAAQAKAAEDAASGTTEGAPTVAPRAHSRAGKAVLWSAVGAVAAGGVVAAIILAGRDGGEDQSPGTTGTVDINGTVVER